MKVLSLITAALIALPLPAFAAEEVLINISMADLFYKSVSLSGPNASVTLNPAKIPNTTLEIKLLAPEPIVVQLKETTTLEAGTSNQTVVETIGKIALSRPGGSVTVTELKGSKFHHPYVITRPE